MSRPDESVRRRFGILAAVGGALLLATAAAILVPLHGSSHADPLRTGYVGSAVCAGCHVAEAQAHAGSDHAFAMDVARDGTVLGRFDGATIEHDGVVSRMHRDGARFLCTTDGADGKRADFEISHVFGVRPLQQYLVSFPDGRKQCLPIAWDSVEQRWFDLYPDEHIPAGDPLHWTGPNQNWNWMCADCHSTDLRRGYDAEHDRYDTGFAEIAVGCEACHGPGEEHLRWAMAGPIGRFRIADRGLCAELRTQSGQIEVCARCHSRRGPLTERAPAGLPFHDVYRLELLRGGLYEVDGTMRDEVYVTGSFLQSRMYHEGVRCSDCHDPHSGKRYAEGNALCVRCHDATRYDRVQHHHHPAGEGAQCTGCHMAQRTYMQVDKRRDHSFRVPRPDLSVERGSPNTCTDCHRDKDAQWAAQVTATWREGRPPYESPFTRQSLWAAAFGADRRGLPEAPDRLRELASAREQPAIVRATALDALAERGDDASALLADALRDPSPLVRAAACGCAALLPPGERLRLLLPLLADPVRRVRVDAAQALSTLPQDSVPAADRSVWEAGLGELAASLWTSAERPESLLTLGALREERGKPEEAERFYRRALQLQPRFVPALLNLAVLLDRLDRGVDALPLLERAVAAEPGFGPSRYSYALALAAQSGRERDALAQLERAVELMPRHGRAFYNLGLLRQRLGDRDGARAALLRARELLPEDGDVVRGLEGLSR
ncbi:MAG: cytochrome c3 family protein [Planctomycetota bacterium]